MADSGKYAYHKFTGKPSPSPPFWALFVLENVAHVVRSWLLGQGAYRPRLGLAFKCRKDSHHHGNAYFSSARPTFLFCRLGKRAGGLAAGRSAIVIGKIIHVRHGLARSSGSSQAKRQVKP